VCVYTCVCICIYRRYMMTLTTAIALSSCPKSGQRVSRLRALANRKSTTSAIFMSPAVKRSVFPPSFFFCSKVQRRCGLHLPAEKERERERERERESCKEVCMFLNLIVSSCEEFLCACRENTFYREGTHSIVKRSCVCVCVSVCIYAGKGGTEAVLVFFDKKLSSCPKNFF